MTRPLAPRLESRRTADFEQELSERASSWLPSWSQDKSAPDFGLALLKVAARFNSEVAERLDGVGDKMALGFLDWLGMKAEAAQPARVPVAFKLAETAPGPVTAQHPVKMQADAAGATVTFETEADLRIVPGTIDIVVGVDPANDEYYLPPPGLTILEPPDALPTQWRFKNFAAAGSTMMQLDPGLGLSEGMLVEIAGAQYEVRTAQDDLVTVAPPLPAGGFENDTLVTKVTTFRPFDGGARNRQEHILYIGDPDLLDVEAAGSIEVMGLTAFVDGVTWEYWGKVDHPADADDVDARWREISASMKPNTGSVLLAKPKGAVEPVQVGAAQARWIRAWRRMSQIMTPADGVQLRINPLPEGTDKPEAIERLDWEKLLRPEVFVNSTSSPPSNFYLLGREPRMFDTLYLASPEAFSKAGATAWLQFELADSTFAALSALREGALANRVLAAVGKDGALHLFGFDPQTGTLAKYRELEPLQPPMPSGGGAADSTARVQLHSGSNSPLPIWLDSSIFANSFHVATWSKGDVWLWHEAGAQLSAWRSLGTVPSVEAQPADIRGLVYLYGTGLGTPPMLIALRDGRLWRTSVSGTPQWIDIEAKDGANPVRFETIAPIQHVDMTTGELLSSVNRGLVGVTANKELYEIAVGTGACTLRLTGVSPMVLPAAALDANGHLAVVVAADGRADLLVYDDQRPVGPAQSATLASAPVGAIAVTYAANALHFLATTNGQGQRTLVSWPRSDQTGFSDVLATDLPPSFGETNGAPLMLPGHALIPGKQAEIFVAQFDLSNRVTNKAQIRPGVLMPTVSSPTLLMGDTVAMLGGGTPIGRSITDNGDTKDGETLYPINQELPAGGAPPLAAYRTSGAPQFGSIDAMQLQRFELESGDRDTTDGTWLLIDGAFRQVTGFFNATSNPRIATIDPPFTSTGNGNYFRPIPTGSRRASYMALNPTTNGNWDAALLQRVPISFPGSIPNRLQAKAFLTDASNHPTLVVLAQPITMAATSPAPFIIDAAAGEWTKSLGDTSTNPDLAWEYWNGTGWWRLLIDEDITSNFRSSGTIKFTVPADLKPAEWSGKTSHWIRARLIGGDYGRENVVVISEPVPGTNQTKQTVQRTTEGIQPPYALNVGIAYAIDKQAAPQFLLTQDSGMLRDQSDANRTPGAEIEVFTPLSVTLGRLDGLGVRSAAHGDPAAENCAPDCECAGGTASRSPAPPDPAATSAPTLSSNAASRSLQPSLYLGLNSKLLGAPVNILFAVDREGAYDKMAPLRVDALIGNRFVPLVAPDETRALGETGLLKMAFPVEPTKAGLFGQPPLTWLRITPSVILDKWTPSLSGVYLNAVWARSAETMTRELLGASSGEPHLTLSLARPPVLQDSLELRVREPLGEEERRALLNQDPNAVKYGIDDLPGDWVLWRQVPDPVDCALMDRVYALDEATGTVRFGDGRQGMIPPIGPDAIVAFRYERADAGIAGIVPANFLEARSELNLVTAVESVETVRAADHSAGGVPTEAPERVLQFAPARLRHRGRAVTAGDFESLVRERSADVVQARCTARSGRVRLVIVMRGKDPAPSRAQQRELRRMLLAVAPPALAAPGALTVEGPAVRRLRVDLKLAVATLDVAGDVADEATKRVSAFFDTELGSESRGGWPLGLSPREEDIAVALLDIPDLDSIAAVNLIEIDREGGERPWPATIRVNELAMLVSEGVRTSMTEEAL